jgi:hypothetical protein
MSRLELSPCSYCGGCGECVAVPLIDDSGKALLFVECPECRGLGQVGIVSQALRDKP